MKIGIFGGSFNPIHIGHAILANYISQLTDVDKVWLMVTPKNPLKNLDIEVSDADRIRMVDMVANNLQNVVTSGFEFTLPQPHYTINTLDTLASKFPNDEFVIIIGADNWNCFDKWKDHDKIISKYGVIVYPRKGFNLPQESEVKNVKFIHDAPLIEISSSFIREGLKNRLNMNYFLPENVVQYISKKGLYTDCSQNKINF